MFFFILFPHFYLRTFYMLFTKRTYFRNKCFFFAFFLDLHPGIFNMSFTKRPHFTNKCFFLILFLHPYLRRSICYLLKGLVLEINVFFTQFLSLYPQKFYMLFTKRTCFTNKYIFFKYCSYTSTSGRSIYCSLKGFVLQINIIFILFLHLYPQTFHIWFTKRTLFINKCFFYIVPDYYVALFYMSFTE